MKTIDDLIDSLLYQYKYENKPFIDTLKELHVIFEETCKVCLGKCPKDRSTCSKECTYKQRSISSKRLVKEGRVSSNFKDCI